MQKHKKYLVITIWISTIAFVGAGFVGWGAYDFNLSRARSVAKVGELDVSFSELQSKYNQLYSYYNSMLGGSLNQEQAQSLGLQELALQAAVDDALLLNFAYEIGLSVSDDDVLNAIINDENFKEDGKFSKALYLQILKNANLDAKEYESGLRKTLAIQKLRQAILQAPLKQDEQMFEVAFFSQDKIGLKIIKQDTKDITIKEDELKALWEKGKDMYKSVPSYTLEVISIPIELKADEASLASYYQEHKNEYLDSDGKIADFNSVKERVLADYSEQETRSNALRKYVQVKKAEILPSQRLELKDDQNDIDLSEIRSAKVGEVLKPFKMGNEFIVAKLVKITPAQTLSYEEAKKDVEKIYIANKLAQNLSSMAQKALDSFKAEQVIWLNREQTPQITGLSAAQALEFKNQLFNKDAKKSFIVLGDVAVVYDILEQNLLKNIDDKYKILLKENAASLKNNELLADLLTKLKKRYEVVEYLKR